MASVAVRAWLLWGLFTLMLLWLFGFNQWVRLWEIVEVSTPQVEAFIAGFTGMGWVQLGLFTLGFLRRRAIYMAVKSALLTMGYILASIGFKRWYKWLIAQLTSYTVRALRALHFLDTWKEYYRAHGWFSALYTAMLLTILTFVGAEFLLALILGNLNMPLWFVQYQAQIMSFVGAYFAATVAQYFLGFVWEFLWSEIVIRLLFTPLPQNVKQWIYGCRIPVFRVLVRLRQWRIALTAQFFYWKTWALSIILTLLGGSAM